jgi:hypothetical protein
MNNNPKNPRAEPCTSTKSTMAPSTWTDEQTLRFSTLMLSKTPWGRRTVTLLEDLKNEADKSAGLEHENQRLQKQLSEHVLAMLRSHKSTVNGVEIEGVFCSLCGQAAKTVQALTCGHQH